MIARLPKMRTALRFFRSHPIFALLLLGAMVIAWTNWGLRHDLPADPRQRLEVLKSANLPAEAEAAYRQLLSISPRDVDLHYAFLQNHFKIPAVKTARRASAEMLAYYQSLAASPETADLGWLGLGLIEDYQENYELALEQYARIHDRQLKYLNLSIGQARLELGQALQAEAYFRSEIIAGGEVARAVSELASQYQKQGRLADLSRLLNDPQYSSYVQFDERRQAALKGGDMAGYLQISMFGPWGWFSLPSGMLALLTGAVWVMYFGRIDLFKRISNGAALGVFMLGAALTPSVFILRDGLAQVVTLEQGNGWAGDLAFALLQISLVEELVKLLPALLVAGLLLRARQPFDWLLYGSLSALGFATFENALYFSHYGFGLAVSRFLYSMPLHLAVTAIAAVAWDNPTSQPRAGWRRLRPLAGFALAVCLHGLYDFFVMDPNGKLQVAGGMLLLMVIYVYGKQIHRALSGLVSDASRLELPVRLDAVRLLIAATLLLLLLNFVLDYRQVSTDIANQRLLYTAMLCLPASVVASTALGVLPLAPRSPTRCSQRVSLHKLIR